MTDGLEAILSAPLLERKSTVSGGTRKSGTACDHPAAPNSPRIHVSPLQCHERSQHFMSAHDEPRSVAMRVLFELLVGGENGYN